ncbi:unnamed protein product [Spirodela intermedia]|nr:unnamed protein product [Spirodela intermedia]CAA6654647.1 unnamed protein product [Spirodela intermedia]
MGIVRSSDPANNPGKFPKPRDIAPSSRMEQSGDLARVDGHNGGDDRFHPRLQSHSRRLRAPTTG